MTGTTLTLSIFLFCIVAANSTQSDVLRCYVCEYSQTNACQTNPDVTTLTSIECSELRYPIPRDGDSLNVTNYVLAKSMDGKFSGAPLIGEIFQGSERQTTTNNTNYVCLTLELSSGDKKGITRLCERHPKNVENVCDFIKKEVSPNFRVDSCKSCNVDNCNSAPIIYNSFIVFVLLYVIHFVRSLSSAS